LFGVIATSHEAFRAAYLFAVGRRPIFGIRKPTITEHNRPITGAPSDATQKLFASWLNLHAPTARIPASVHGPVGRGSDSCVPAPKT
jgi:hypothetical protein